MKFSAPLFELCCTILIALVLLLGGRGLIVQLAGFHAISLIVLLVIFALLTFSLRRDRRMGGPLMNLSVTRDVGFLCTIVCVELFILSPQRWSLGASTVMLELALALEIFRKIAEITRTEPR